MQKRKKSSAVSVGKVIFRDSFVKVSKSMDRFGNEIMGLSYDEVVYYILICQIHLSQKMRHISYDDR